MSNEGKDKPKKKKCPTAMKRMKQNIKKNLQNRSFKSRVKTSIRAYESALLTKDKEKIQSALNSIYSLMDKGVKLGAYKKNKAARTKSHAADLMKSA